MSSGSSPAQQSGGTPTTPLPTVVVTGLGAVSPYGWTVAALAAGLARGECAITGARRLDTSGHRTKMVAEVAEPPSELTARFPQWRRWSQAERFGVVAALAAVADARAEAMIETRPERVGVFFGGSTAGMLEAEALFERPRKRRTPMRGLSAQPLNSPGDTVARTLGVRGPVETVSSACASGALALRAAIDALRAGEIDFAIAGGTDSLCQLTYAGFNSLRAVDAGPCRPFREDRAGLSLGEGAGVLLLEREADVRRREARVRASLLGAGASCDAHHMTAPHPQGKGAEAAIRAALRDAGIEGERIGMVNAHGTGTQANDPAELAALQAVFGPRFAGLPITSTKAAIGHFLGASGAIEAVAVVLDLERRAVHAMPTVEIAGEKSAGALTSNVVLGRSRELAPGDAALSTSFAFGGANAAIVFAPAQECR